eukprot:263111_1
MAHPKKRTYAPKKRTTIGHDRKRCRASQNTNSHPQQCNDSTEKLITKYLSKLGHSSFRNKQREIIRDVINGHNVFLCMATGSGKSLCFQLSTLVRNELQNARSIHKPAIGIVISPLIALMSDQVSKLQRHGIAAALWNSSLNSQQKAQFKYDIQIGKIDIVYTTPESLLSRTNGIKDLLIQHRTVTTFCIDETHCILMWGSSFRPSYFRLAESLKEFNHPPVSACTATVQHVMRKDIL